MYPASQKLAYINPLSISFEKKTKTTLFFVPDFGAHALYQCFNKSKHNYFIPETRYLNELRNVFHRNEKTNKIGGVGIKYIQRLSDLEADNDVREFLEKLIAPSVRLRK